MEPQWYDRISGTESQINEDNEDKHLRTDIKYPLIFLELQVCTFLGIFF